MSVALTDHPPWRAPLLICGSLALLIVLAVLSFAWPAARIAPRHLPLGIVGTNVVAEQAVAGLEHAEPDGFDVAHYADEAAARRAIEDRAVYGALTVTQGRVTVLTASAASPMVAQLLTQVGMQLGNQMAARRPTSAAHPDASVTSVDVVATSAQDPRGLVISSALLPLTIFSVIIAAVIALLVNVRPAWRQLVTLVTVSGAAGLGAYLVAQGFLGALPHQHAASWAAVSLTILAMSASVTGLIALVGPTGLGVGAVLLVFVGNPFSGVTSAPELLPTAVADIGKWLPPGAGANLLRSTAYFGGNGAATHLVVLLLWSFFGLLAVVIGHHTLLGHAYRQGHNGKHVR
jgi:hypothetical protein